MRICVTPSNAVNSGSESCSAWTPVGHLVALYANEDYGGTSAMVAYERSSRGTCFNLSSYSLIQAVSSLKFHGVSGLESTLWLFQGSDCAIPTATYTLPADGEVLTPSVSAHYGSSWDNAAVSFKVTW